MELKGGRWVGIIGIKTMKLIDTVHPYIRIVYYVSILV